MAIDATLGSTLLALAGAALMFAGLRGTMSDLDLTRDTLLQRRERDPADRGD